VGTCEQAFFDQLPNSLLVREGYCQHLSKPVSTNMIIVIIDRSSGRKLAAGMH
jgi:hypothetical protein